MKNKLFFVFILVLVSIFFFTAIHWQLCHGTAGRSAVPEAFNVYPKVPYKEFFGQSKFSSSLHAPSIMELPNGELLAVWHASLSDNQDAAIWGATRPVGAKKWNDPVMIYNTPGFADKNPVLYLGPDKKLLLFWSVVTRKGKWHGEIVRVKVSRDYGQTWGDAYNLGTPLGFLTRTHPIRLRNGWVILPLYVDWSASSAMIISKDDGLTWGQPRYILRFLGTQPTIIQRSDLSLFTLMRSGMWPRRCWQAISTNFGGSWKNYEISGIDNPGSSIEMIKLRSGRVALVFNNARIDRFNLSIALSDDDGRSWPYLKTIEDTSGHSCSYPSVIQDGSGLIHVVYSYNNQTTIAHFVTDEEWIMR